MLHHPVPIRPHRGSEIAQASANLVENAHLPSSTSFSSQVRNRNQLNPGSTRQSSTSRRPVDTYSRSCSRSSLHPDSSFSSRHFYSISDQQGSGSALNMMSSTLHGIFGSSVSMSSGGLAPERRAGSDSTWTTHDHHAQNHDGAGISSRSQRILAHLNSAPVTASADDAGQVDGRISIGDGGDLDNRNAPGRDDADTLFDSEDMNSDQEDAVLSYPVPPIDLYERLQAVQHQYRSRRPNYGHSRLLSSQRIMTSYPEPRTKPAFPNRSLRTLGLFVLGAIQGFLIFHLHQHPSSAKEKPGPAPDWPYLVFWGAIAVNVGSILPWIDSKWADFVKGGDEDAAQSDRPSRPPAGEVGNSGRQDRNTVVRSIGLFLGILYGIVSYCPVDTIGALLLTLFFFCRL